MIQDRIGNFSAADSNSSSKKDSAIEERGTNNRIMYTSLMYKYSKIGWDISYLSSRNKA